MFSMIKKNIFCSQQISNLLSKIKGYTINSYDFFKVNVFLLKAVTVIIRCVSRNSTYTTDQATGDTVGEESLTSTINSENRFFSEYTRVVESISN
jgi:hypothetical protein